jgi:hypothetical protein
MEVKPMAALADDLPRKNSLGFAQMEYSDSPD